MFSDGHSGRHSRQPLELNQPADVVTEVHHPDLKPRPRDADGAHDLAAHRVLLVAEYVLDTRAHPRARRVRRLLALRQRTISCRAPVDTALQALRLQARARNIAFSLKMLAEALKQLVDQLGLRQRFAKQPDRGGIRHRVLELQIEKAHERYAVADQVLSPIVREIVERLQHHDLELQDRVIGLAAGVALALLGLRLRHGLDVSTEILPWHDLLDRFQRIAQSADRLQHALNIEKALLPHNPPAPSAHDRARSSSQIRGDLARGIFRGALKFRTKDFEGEYFHYTGDLFFIYKSGHLMKLMCQK